MTLGKLIIFEQSSLSGQNITPVYFIIMHISTERYADGVIILDYDRPHMLNGENGVADRQSGDGGHHRLVLELPQFRQYNINRQGGDQEDSRDDADDADERALPHRRYTLGYQILIEAHEGDLIVVSRRIGYAKTE